MLPSLDILKVHHSINSPVRSASKTFMCAPFRLNQPFHKCSIFLLIFCALPTKDNAPPDRTETNLQSQAELRRILRFYLTRAIIRVTAGDERPALGQMSSRKRTVAGAARWRPMALTSHPFWHKPGPDTTKCNLPGNI